MLFWFGRLWLARSCRSWHNSNPALRCCKAGVRVTLWSISPILIGHLRGRHTAVQRCATDDSAPCTVLTKRHDKLALWGASMCSEPSRSRGAAVRHSWPNSWLANERSCKAQLRATARVSGGVMSRPDMWLAIYRPINVLVFGLESCSFGLGVCDWRVHVDHDNKLISYDKTSIERIDMGMIAKN